MHDAHNLKDKMLLGCLYGQAIGDADTNGAIACAILGAKFGYSSIPPYYVENLHNRDVP